MRPAFALAILLLGLKASAAETRFQDVLPPAGGHAATSLLEHNVTIGSPDLKVLLPPESSESPHDQAEAPGEPPHAKAPAPAARYSGNGEEAHSVSELCHALLASAQDNGLPVPFFANLLWQESRFKLDARSRVGALGIAQFMPAVAREVGLLDPFDPHEAIPASARFLNMLRQHFGNLGFVAAAYNAGTSRVADWLGHRRGLPRETQTYVVRVTGHTAETWRKAPVRDTQVAFAGELPCRKFSAFAEVEQARRRETPAPEDAPDPELVQADEPAPKPSAIKVALAARKVAHRAGAKSRVAVAPKPGKSLAEILQIAAEPKAARAPAAAKVARNVQTGKRESAARHPHSPKGRVAQSD